MSALTWITNKARSIRRGNKSMTWKTAIKKAGVEYRAKHKAKPVKKSSRRVGAAKKYATVKRIKTELRKTGKVMPHGYEIKKGSVRSITGDYKSKREGAGSGFNAGDKQKENILRIIKERLHDIDRAELEIFAARASIKRMPGISNAPYRKVYQRKIQERRKLIVTHRAAIRQLKKLL